MITTKRLRRAVVVTALLVAAAALWRRIAEEAVERPGGTTVAGREVASAPPPLAAPERGAPAAPATVARPDRPPATRAATLAEVRDVEAQTRACVDELRKAVAANHTIRFVDVGTGRDVDVPNAMDVFGPWMTIHLGRYEPQGYRPEFVRMPAAYAIGPRIGTAAAESSLARAYLAIEPAYPACGADVRIVDPNREASVDPTDRTYVEATIAGDRCGYASEGPRDFRRIEGLPFIPGAEVVFDVAKRVNGTRYRRGRVAVALPAERPGRLEVEVVLALDATTPDESEQNWLERVAERVPTGAAEASSNLDPKPRETSGATLAIEVLGPGGRPRPFAAINLSTEGQRWIDLDERGTQRIDPYVDHEGRRTCAHVLPGRVRLDAQWLASKSTTYLEVGEGERRDVNITLP